MKIMKNNVLIGIFLMIVHCLALSIMNAFSRIASPDVNPIQFGFFVSLFGFCIMLPFAIYYKYKLIGPHQKINIIRSSICTFDQILLYYTFTKLKFVHVTAITLAYPIVATILAVLILKEKIKIRRIISIIIGIIGSLIIIDPTGESFSPIVLLVVVVILCWGILDIITKIATEKNSNIGSQITYIMLFTALFALPFTAVFWQDFDFIDYLIPLAGGGLSFVVCMMSLYMAFSKTEICILVPLYFSTLVFSAVIGYVLFGEIISMQTMLGSVIVTISSSYIAYREYVVNNQKNNHR